jgi:hypothetical protein
MTQAFPSETLPPTGSPISFLTLNRTVRRTILAMDGISMEQQQDNETYLFGVSSPSIRSSILVGFPSCGVYATNRRLFFVRGSLKVRLMPLVPFLAALALLGYSSAMRIIDFPGVTGFILDLNLLGWVFLLVEFSTLWYNDYSRVPIQELERRRIFEIEAGQISRIILKDRGNWLVSSMAIFSKSGEKRVIRFGANGSFKHVWLCLQHFRPEVLVYIPF